MFSWHEPIRGSSRFVQSASGVTDRCGELSTLLPLFHPIFADLAIMMNRVGKILNSCVQGCALSGKG